MFDELEPAAHGIKEALRAAQRTDTIERDRNKKQHHQRCYQTALGVYLALPIAVTPLPVFMKRWATGKQRHLSLACGLVQIGALFWLNKVRSDTLALASTLEAQRERTLAKLCLSPKSEHEAIIEQSRVELSFLLARMDQFVTTQHGDFFFQAGSAPPSKFQEIQQTVWAAA